MYANDITNLREHFENQMVIEKKESKIKNIEICLEPIYKIINKKKLRKNTSQSLVFESSININSKEGYIYSFLKPVR